jgi:Fe-S-cluster containining protein
MDDLLRNSMSRVCSECELGGGCCIEARPPLTEARIKILLANGVNMEQIEFGKYKRLKVKPDGSCVLFENGGCSVHSFKPETCVAGPFTFDVIGSILKIYLKKKSICPLAGFLKKNREIYNRFFDLAVSKILVLVNDLPNEELVEILKIDEPETELVAEIELK